MDAHGELHNLPEEEVIIEPNGDMRSAAASIRQMYLAFEQAGFTPEQAMALTMHILPNLEAGK